MRLVAAMILAPVLSGCVVQSLQLDEVRARAPGRGSVPADARPFQWRLEFNGARYVVFPVAQGDGFVFRDAGAIEVGFDGVDVTYVRGLPGAVGDFEIRRGVGSRRIERPGLAPQPLDCAPIEEAGRGWRTRCTATIDGRGYPMDAEGLNGPDGGLQAVTVALVPGAAPLVLRRAGSPSGAGL